MKLRIERYTEQGWQDITDYCRMRWSYMETLGMMAHEYNCCTGHPCRIIEIKILNTFPKEEIK